VQPITGKSISEGMVRLINTNSSKKWALGPTDMTAVLNECKNSKTSTMEIDGAMGRPTWDSKGTRHDPASIWCVKKAPAYPAFPADVLRYTDDPSPALVGDFKTACGFDFPAP